MKGMIIKDILLMRKQWGIILLMFAVAFYMSCATTPGFFILFPYITLFGCIQGLTTLTYDQMENRPSFFFTLPVTRKEYILAKYLFLAGMVAVFLLTSYLFLILFYAAASAGLFENTFLQEFTQDFLSAGSFWQIYTGKMLRYLFLGLILIAIEVPPQIYFGKEKGWIIILLVLSFLLGTGAVVYGGAGDGSSGMTNSTPVIQKLAESITWWLNHPDLLSILAGIIGIVSYLLSIKLSTRILEKRDI